MRALYISHNGMLEPLGQAQVLPYLRGLARRGVDYDLVSFELPDVTEREIEELRASLAADRIHWTPLRRRRDRRLGVKVKESARGVIKALTAALAHKPAIVHGRSYLPTAVSDVVASLVPRARLVFDCRGMLGDEYLDAGYWAADSVEYRLVKQYEARAFRRARGVVVLTEALRTWILDREWIGPDTRLEAIPCCVDLERFRFDADARVRIRRELKVDDRLVIVYAGSLGTWYREPDLSRFVRIMRERAGRPITFLILTRTPTDAILRMLAAEGIRPDEIVVHTATTAEMPGYLSAADLGLSFIKSCFSKTGSSPTKVAEYLACGLPVVLNGDIGDQADLRSEKEACVVLDSFEDEELTKAAEAILHLAERPVEERLRATRRVAEARFDLERIGVARYSRLYGAVLGTER
jgi:glycosyltransferase involved in cell wall biosynthesis